MKEIAILLVAVLATCVAEKLWPCSNMSNDCGKTVSVCVCVCVCVCVYVCVCVCACVYMHVNVHSNIT